MKTKNLFPGLNNTSPITDNKLMENKDRRKLSFIISVALHVLLIVILLFNESSQQQLASKEVEIEWVDIIDLEKTKAFEQAQIVQQDDKSINDVIPEKDYKLSKNNQEVIKETKAEKNGAFKNRTSLNDGQQVPQKQVQKPSNKQKKFALSDLKPMMFDNSYDESKLAANPTPAKRGSEISQNDDYLKDVVAGAQTLLKTREFVYYSYYNRIKKKLRQHWEPRIKKKIVKIMRKGRKIAAVNDKITRLVITLNQSGNLVRIQVKGASGYNDLDDAAIEAFKAAAPFPNPPLGIVSAQGEVQINWDFVLET